MYMLCRRIHVHWLFSDLTCMYAAPMAWGPGDGHTHAFPPLYYAKVGHKKKLPTCLTPSRPHHRNIKESPLTSLSKIHLMIKASTRQLPSYIKGKHKNPSTRFQIPLSETRNDRRSIVPSGKSHVHRQCYKLCVVMTKVTSDITSRPISFGIAWKTFISVITHHDEVLLLLFMTMIMYFCVLALVLCT